MGFFDIISREERRAAARTKTRKELIDNYNKRVILANHSNFVNRTAITSRDDAKKRLLDFLAEEDDVICGLKRLKRDLDRGTGPLGDLDNHKNMMNHLEEFRFINRYIQDTIKIRLGEIEKGLQ